MLNTSHLEFQSRTFPVTPAPSHLIWPEHTRPLHAGSGSDITDGTPGAASPNVCLFFWLVPNTAWQPLHENETRTSVLDDYQLGKYTHKFSEEMGLSAGIVEALEDREVRL